MGARGQGPALARKNIKRWIEKPTPFFLFPSTFFLDLFPLPFIFLSGRWQGTDTMNKRKRGKPISIEAIRVKTLECPENLL
jgi:hypothetical protein